MATQFFVTVSEVGADVISATKLIATSPGDQINQIDSICDTRARHKPEPKRQIRDSTTGQIRNGAANSPELSA